MQKALFGAYLNTAQHNAYMIINEINEKLGGESDTKEDKLPVLIDSLLKKGELTKRKKAALFLVEHFPFLKAFVNQDADVKEDEIMTIYDYLRIALRRLHQERNINSHWHDQPKKENFLLDFRFNQPPLFELVR